MSALTSLNQSETSRQEPLSTLETLRLGAAHAYYSVSRALRLDKVSALLQRAELAEDTPIALLGRSYSPGESPSDEATREVLSHLVHHFHSTLWMTYRSEFTALPAGETCLRTDAGWGCTLRSVQMIAAQAMLRHILGPEWRLPLVEAENAGSAAIGMDPPEGLAPLLRLFWDVPVPSSPFSIHNLCLHGATCGVSPGRWLGPWTGCRALEAAAGASPLPLLGLRIKVLGGVGGGAPVLAIDRFLPSFNNVKGEENATEEAPLRNDLGLLLLVPLVLGVGKLNPVYAPQLRAVLAMPQSVGIVGGRPGSSVYVVGCQGESILYLDPHTIQPAACSDGDWRSFSCDVLRTLSLFSLDPSLALGFFCSNKEEYLDLYERLRALERENTGTPLVCVREGLGEEDDSGGQGCDEQSWERDDVSEESEEESDLGVESEEEGENGVEKVESIESEARNGIMGIALEERSSPLKEREEVEEDEGGELLESANKEGVKSSFQNEDINLDIEGSSEFTEVWAGEVAEAVQSHHRDVLRCREKERGLEEGPVSPLRQASSTKSAWELI